MKHLPAVLALGVLAFASIPAKADPITYTFNQTLVQDATDYATVTGTVTTDGNLGNITLSDINTFDLFVNENAGNQTESLELSSALAHSAGSSGLFGSGYFSAAADTLSFDFSQGDWGFGGYGTGYLYFYTGHEEAFVKSLSGPAVNAPESGFQVVATEVSPTPEPSSLLLSGTGVVAMAGVARRRLFR